MKTSGAVRIVLLAVGFATAIAVGAVADSAQPVTASSVTVAPNFSWSANVLGPVARFAGIMFVLGILIVSLNLRSVLKARAWSERTIIALAIVVTFCAAVFLGVPDDVFKVVKDLTLIVIGFYFGASTGASAKGSVEDGSASVAVPPNGEPQTDPGKPSTEESSEGARIEAGA